MLNILRIARLGADAARWAAPHVQEWKRARNLNEDEAWRNLASKNWGEAERYFNLALLESRHGEAKQLEFLLGLTEAQRRQAQFPQAEETARKAIELATRLKNHPQRLGAMDVLADLYLEQGRPAVALSVAEEIVELERSRPKPDNQALVKHLRKLGEVHLLIGNLDKAAEICEECVKLAEQSFGSDHGETADCLASLGAVLRRLGKQDDAQLFLRGALEIHRRVRGQNSQEVARDLDHLAGSLEDSGNLEAAAKEYEKALSLRERQIGVDPQETAWLKIRLGALYLQTGRSSASRELLTHAIRVLEKTSNDRYLVALEVMAQAEEHAGRGNEAVRLRHRAEQVLATREAPLQLKSYDLAENLSVMPAPMTTPISLWRGASADPEPEHAAVPAQSAVAIWKPQPPVRDLGDLQQLLQTLSAQLEAQSYAPTPNRGQPVAQASHDSDVTGSAAAHSNLPDASLASFYRQMPRNVPQGTTAAHNPAASQSDGLERLSQQVIQSGVFQPSGMRAKNGEAFSQANSNEESSSGFEEAGTRATIPKYVTLTDSAAEPHTYILTPLTLPPGQMDPERAAALLAAVSQQVASGQITSHALPPPEFLIASRAAETQRNARDTNDKPASPEVTSTSMAVQPSIPPPRPAASPEIQQSLPDVQTDPLRNEPTLQHLVRIPVAKIPLPTPPKPEDAEAGLEMLSASSASWPVQLPAQPPASLSAESFAMDNSPTRESEAPRSNLASALPLPAFQYPIENATGSGQFAAPAPLASGASPIARALANLNPVLGDVVESDGAPIDGLVQSDGAAPSAAARLALPPAHAVPPVHPTAEIAAAPSLSTGSPLLPEHSWKESSQNRDGILAADASFESLAHAPAVPLELVAISPSSGVSPTSGLKPDLTPVQACAPLAHSAYGLTAEAPSQTPHSAPLVVIALPGDLATPWKDRRQPRVAPQFPKDRVSLPASGQSRSEAGIPAQASRVEIAVHGRAQSTRQFGCAPDFAEARLNVPAPYRGRSETKPETQLGHGPGLAIPVGAGHHASGTLRPLVAEAPAFRTASFPAQLPGRQMPFALLSALETWVPTGGLLPSQTQIGKFSQPECNLDSIRVADVRAWMPRYRDTRVLYPRPNQHKLSGDDLEEVGADAYPQGTQPDRAELTDPRQGASETPTLPAIIQQARASVSDSILPIFGAEEPAITTEEDLPIF